MKVAIQRRNYNTIIERHSNMPVVGMDTTFMINTFQTLKLEHGMDLPLSLVAIQGGLRLCHSGLRYLLRKKVDDDYYQNKIKRLTIGLNS